MSIDINSTQDFILKSSKNVLYVGGDGPNNYSRIQDGINAANIEDIVFVYPGIYYENIVVDISIKLIGIEGFQNTVIDGNQNSIPLIVNANNCEISGFTIRNPGNNFDHISCASLRADSCNFKNNNILMKKVYQAVTKAAVEVSDGSKNIISNNIISFIDENPLIERGILIRNYAHGTEIKENNISKFGVGIEVDRKCNDTKILNNFIHYNSNAIIIFGNKCNISHNEVFYNRWWGITIQDGKDSTIFKNNIQGINDEDSGIMIYESARKVIVKRNLVKDNGLYGIYLVNCNGMVVTENNMLNSDIYIFKHLKSILRKNIIDNNYYSNVNTNSFGWQIIHGELLIFSYFEYTLEIAWKTFDKNPVEEPFAIFYQYY
jgi:parallel beta-helix repeat protein